MARPLDGIGLVILYVVGIVVAEHMAVCALGIDIDDKKHMLGLRKGASENASVCKALVTNLAERDLKTDGLLVVIDGSKACRINSGIRGPGGREGLEETMTVNRLMLIGAFQRTLRSTNPIESAIEMARTTARRVKRWRNGNQVLRWALAGLKEAERRFRRVASYRVLPLRRARLKGEVLHTTVSEAASASIIKRAVT